MTKQHTLAILALSSAFLLGGCAGTVKSMREAPVEKSVAMKPEPGKALVVFMRPSGLGFAVQSSVFDVKDNQPSLVGIVAAKAKVAYQAPPGVHLFMVIGESADYMEAELLPDLTYYAQVSPRMGMWKARFSVEPVKPATLDTATFKTDRHAASHSLHAGLCAALKATFDWRARPFQDCASAPAGSPGPSGTAR